MARAYDKKVRPTNLNEDGLVLKMMLPFKEDPRGKFKPNDEGPYLDSKLLSGGVLILSQMDGNVIPSPFNSDSVKKYYV